MQWPVALVSGFYVVSQPLEGMANQRGKSLVVLILLQLCRAQGKAEIKDRQPQWYSANIINDGFQPKPISEIFSTETTFSTASPIVVASDGSDNYSGEDGYLSSTLAPPTSLFSTTPFEFTKISTRSTYSSPKPSSLPPMEEQYTSKMTTFQQTFPETNSPSLDFSQQTSPEEPNTRPIIVTESPPLQRNVQIEQEEPTFQTFQPTSSVTVPTTVYQSPMIDTTQTRDIRFTLPQTQSTFEPMQTTPRPMQTVPFQPQHPNYFLIYQQAPQSFPNFPPMFRQPPPPQTTQREIIATRAPPVTSTIPPTFSTPIPTFTTRDTPTPTIGPVFSTQVTQQISSTTTTLPPSPVTSPSTIRVSTARSSTIRSTRRAVRRCQNSTTPMPRVPAVPEIPGFEGVFPLKIRVLTPSGSITNVNINPVNKVPPTPRTTTTRTTTTRRPTTRRTPKPKKNTHERCLQGCRKRGQPLCAAPLGESPINPKNLRGFPSVCHMACHNSYRKNPYEKVIDGSCGRLRTRIQPIDSNTKLKKDELHKVQYILDNPGQKAIVEFTGLYS